MRGISGALVATSVVFTFGCATSQVEYDKPRRTQEQRRRDVSDCALASLGHQPERHVITPIMIEIAPRSTDVWKVAATRAFAEMWCRLAVIVLGDGVAFWF